MRVDREEHLHFLCHLQSASAIDEPSLRTIFERIAKRKSLAGPETCLDRPIISDESGFCDETCNPGQPRLDPPFVAGPVRRRDFPGKGAGLYTSQALQAGQRLMAESPLLSWLSSDHLEDYCDLCAGRLGFRRLACERCLTAFYCSDACRRAAFTRYHRIECDLSAAGLRLGKLQFDLRAVCTKLSEGRAAPNDEDHTCRSDPDHLRDALGETSSFEAFAQKQTFFGALGPKERLCFAFVALVELRLLQQLGIDPPDAEHLLLQLYRFKIVDNINSFVLEDERCADGRPIGHVIYQRTSLLNHSCRPNCGVSFAGNHSLVRAKRDLRPGEELLISYLPADQLADRGHARRLLKAFFYFDCECGRCIQAD